MHLDHKIPWNAIADHLVLIRSNPSCTPPRSDLFWNKGYGKNAVAEKAILQNVQDHFIRVLISTIRDFAATQSAKRATLAANLLTGKLISDELIAFAEDRYDLLPHGENSVEHNSIAREDQDIESWRRAANPEDDPIVEPNYTTANADLADATKLLITLAATTARKSQESALIEEAQIALLRLSTDPLIPLHRLDNLSWGHGFGVSLLARLALEIYILINLYGAVNELPGGNKGKLSILEMQRLLDVLGGDALSDYDYPAQNIPHRAYWHRLGVTWEWICRQRQHSDEERNGLATAEIGEAVVDPLAEGQDADVRDRLKEYLKTCFAILYIYDGLRRKWYGDEEADEKWTEEIQWVFDKIRCRR
ncbi:hypothetical protein D6D21_08851 [Aureobasidium pullulans]|uniref:HNH nuclease domain-containing protein n=1 Tax=Aureobasidium pullulans TaxID=5580 RepID=A0AB74ILY1_AURPU|nr:hypothetical protein D6D21_08851 [Aureobasidium pullulans]